MNCVDLFSGPECDVFALLTRSDGRAVELWSLRVNASDGNATLPQPVALSVRDDLFSFEPCFVPNWAYSVGLSAAALTVGPRDGAPSQSSWSFAVNRASTSLNLDGSCGFSDTTRVVNDPVGFFDEVGPLGQAWSTFSRGVNSTTGLAMITSWDPMRRAVTRRLAQTIRTLHTRGDSAVPSTLETVVAEESGSLAFGLYTSTGTSWQIGAIRP